MQSPKIIVVGSYNRDTTFVVNHFPQAGETIAARSSSSSHGGKGSNQAVQAVRFGASVGMIAVIGNDPIGDAALEMWCREGIDVAAVKQTAVHATGSATVLSRSDGQNFIVLDTGANECVAVSTVREAETAIRSAKLVVAQLETPQSATIAAFEIARRHNVITMLNVAPVPERIEPGLLNLVDILVVNEVEACSLSAPIQCLSDPERAAEALLPRVGSAVLLTLGAGGAVLYEKNGKITRQPAAVATTVVDTTGAGDALIGAFAASYIANGDMHTALRWGVAAGSFACTKRGAIASFGRMAEITASRRVFSSPIS